jgi:hypothetical protein
MVLLSDLKTFKLNYSDLDQIAYFYWMSEYILTHYYSDDYTVKVLPDVLGFGAHWGGLILDVRDNEGNQKAICHTGLVYHPNTKTGIYFETESWKNPRNYKKLWRDVEPSDGYDLIKDETDFLKFFFPERKLEELMNAGSIDKQMQMLTEYYDACFRGIIKAADK